MSLLIKHVLLQSLYRKNALLTQTSAALFCSKTIPPAVKTFDKTKFDKMVKNNKVVIFMKGTPDAPRCGFSNAVVQILRMHGVNYDAHNVLESDQIREGIKTYSDWPTIPQIFIDGEFIGGCDILLQMHQEGLLIEELKKVGIISELQKKADEAGTTDKQKEK